MYLSLRKFDCYPSTTFTVPLDSMRAKFILVHYACANIKFDPCTIYKQGSKMPTGISCDRLPYQQEGM